MRDLKRVSRSSRWRGRIFLRVCRYTDGRPDGSETVHPFQDYGNGRRDCAYSDDILHPDSLSFARAVAILGGGKDSWVFPG